MEPSPVSPEYTPPSAPPLIWQRVRETWLSQKPSKYASIITAITTLLLVLGSLIYQTNFLHLHHWMEATQTAVFDQHQWWRLWTTLFAHADVGHLVSNSILFFILGYFLTGYFGVFLFPLAAFAFGGLTNWIVIASYPPTVALIGVSGVVYWMGGAWLALYFLLDRRRTYFQRTLRIVGVALGIFMPATAFDPAISYKAHLVGFILGLTYGFLYYWRHQKTFKQALVIETIIDE